MRLGNGPRARARLVLGLAVGLLLSGVLTTDALAARCRLRRSVTVVNNRVARVLKIETSNADFLEHKYYGCLYRSGRRILLASDSASNSPGAFSDQVAGGFVLAGPLVAFYSGFGVVSGGDPSGGHQSVRVVDLRTRRVLHDSDVRVGMSLVDDGVHRVVLRPTGSVAWSDVIGSGPEIRAASSSGSVLLDSGAGVQPDSLRLTGTTLSWRNSGTIKTATLD